MTLHRIQFEETFQPARTFHSTNQPFDRIAIIFMRFALLILTCCSLQPPAFSEEVVHTDLSAIRALETSESIGTLVDFEATVTYVSGMQEFLFVQSGQDAIFVYKPNFADVDAGQRVRIRGRLAKGDLLPIVSESKVDLISDGKMPAPEKASAIGVEHDCRYLSLEFDILQTRIGVSESQLYARTAENRKVCIDVRHPNGIESPSFSFLAGHRARVCGVLGLQLDGGAFREPGMADNKIVGYKIFCNSTKCIQVVNQDKFDSRERARTVGLSFIDNDSFPEGRFRTVGQICLVESDLSNLDTPEFVVCDGSTFKRFKLHSGEELRSGMVMTIGGTKTIDSFGRPAFSVDYLCDLTQAEFPEQDMFSVKDATKQFTPDRRIAVEGTPLRIENRDGQPHLILGEDGATIAVSFQEEAMDSLASLDPKIASRVRVTGVTKTDSECDFGLVVTRASDAKLVESKASMSRMVGIGLGVLLAICAIAAFWINMLRNQVAQKQRFESIFDNAGCPIIVFNGDLQIIDANQLAANMSEYSKEELRGLTIPQIDQHIPKRNMLRVLSETMRKQNVIIYPTRILTKNNKPLELEVHCRNLTKSDDPAKATYIAIFPDVTARNKYENELKVARDEAIKANKAKSRFVASMSHELRTPLNGVIGMTQLLERTNLTPVQADYLAACRTSGETLLTVIGDVLDFSKMEAGKLKLKPQETSLIPFIENVVRATSLQKAARHVDLASFVDPKLSRSVMVDSDRFRQVIFNLIGNAAKFTSKGSITVTAKCNEVTSQWADVRFVVADTGIGIPKDRIDSLFEAFEQCDSSSTRQYGGTGLGLTICKQIVDLMKGQIHVKSVEGEGSQFIVEVRLPFAREQESVVDTRNLSAVNKRVAVFGMSDPISQLLADTFRTYQCQTTCFNDTDLVPSDQFDFVFFNARDGLESATEFIEKQVNLLDGDEWPSLVPVVAANCPLKNSDWKKLGMENPIRKPISQTRILEVFDSRIATDGEIPHREDLTLASQYGRQRRVLICEDVPVNQMFAKEICRKAGIECIVSENGRAGIRTLEKDSQFDIIFMDCDMPVMDGFEASRRIRKMTELGLIPRIPIIALTASALSGDREKCLEAGMDDYLTKPFEIDQFLEKIQHHSLKTTSEIQPRSLEQSQSPVSIFNIEKLAEQFEDRAFALDLARQFSESFSNFRGDLENSLLHNDTELTFSIAHRIKGVAGIVQAERISDIACRMESTVRDGQPEELLSQVEEILQEFENFTNAFHNECSASSSPD